MQIQKLLFLIDREIPEQVGGPHFRFVPYHYGPFDERVYGVLHLLERKGQVTVDRTGPYPCYALTDLGLKEGLGILRTLAPTASDYLTQAADWVRRLFLFSAFEGHLRSISRHGKPIAGCRIWPGQLTPQGSSPRCAPDCLERPAYWN